MLIHPFPKSSQVPNLPHGFQTLNDSLIMENLYKLDVFIEERETHPLNLSRVCLCQGS